MQSLPNEIIPIIFGFIQKITDKRMFIRTCKIYNNLTKILIKKVELNNLTRRKLSLYISYLKHNAYTVERFTLELCFDSYLDLIPMSYINRNNVIIIDVAIIWNNIKLLEMAINNGCELSYYNRMLIIDYDRLDMIKLLGDKIKWDKNTSARAISNGKLDIIIWAKQNNLELDIRRVHEIAIIYGQLNIVKWTVLENGIKIKLDDYKLAIDYEQHQILEWFDFIKPIHQNNMCIVKKKKYSAKLI